MDIPGESVAERIARMRENAELKRMAEEKLKEMKKEEESISPEE